MIEDVIAGWIGGAITVAFLWLVRTGRSRLGRRYGKFTLYRVIRLRLRRRGDSPFYVRRHHTLPGVEEPVFDETWILNGAQSNYPTRFEPLPISSSGVVDAFQILPVVAASSDNHPHRRLDPRHFEFTHPEPTDRIAATGVLVNGLQDEKDWWFATTAQYDNQDLVLVVDFSSLPFASEAITHVEGVHVRRPAPERAVEEPLGTKRFGSDIISLNYPGARKNDTIMIRFRLDVGKLGPPAPDIEPSRA